MYINPNHKNLLSFLNFYKIKTSGKILMFLKTLHPSYCLIIDKNLTKIPVYLLNKEVKESQLFDKQLELMTASQRAKIKYKQIRKY